MRNMKSIILIAASFISSLAFAQGPIKTCPSDTTWKDYRGCNTIQACIDLAEIQHNEVINNFGVINHSGIDAHTRNQRIDGAIIHTGRLKCVLTDFAELKIGENSEKFDQLLHFYATDYDRAMKARNQAAIENLVAAEREKRNRLKDKWTPFVIINPALAVSAALCGDDCGSGIEEINDAIYYTIQSTAESICELNEVQAEDCQEYLTAEIRVATAKLAAGQI